MFILTVPNIAPETFEAYYYGYGEVIAVEQGTVPNTSTYTVDYSDDEYRANYQAGRFASGLYFASVEEV